DFEDVYRNPQKFDFSESNLYKLYGKRSYKETRDAYFNESDDIYKGETRIREESGDIVGDESLLTPEPSTIIKAEIIRDLWTTDDTLGYSRYAHAIKEYIIQKKTEAPLTIGIHAPWGGGKTSLMRMIQKDLDPKGFESTSNPPPTIPVSITINKAMKLSKDFLKKDEKTTIQTKKPITFWFNVWKYESSDQIWAGIIDTIVQQYIFRIGEDNKVDKREEFIFNLNLRRKGTNEFVNEVRKIKYQKFLPLAIFSSIIILLIYLITFMVDLAYPETQLDLVRLVATILTVAIASAKFIVDSRSIGKDKAIKFFNEYFQPPSYISKLGFAHQAEQELRFVLELIQEEYDPITIFVDDLDRVSPTKVAEVVEALNSLLNQDLPKSIFVLGLDAEIVASALEVYYKNIIDEMPSYAKHTRIGWKFMDKLIQLPFTIPSIDEEDLLNYASSLFYEEKKDEAPPSDEIVKIINKTQILTGERTKSTKTDPTEYNRKFLAQKEKLKRKQQELFENITKLIIDYVENTELIDQIIEDYTINFSNNPRELKRFVNLFSFFSFLSKAREVQNQPVPSTRQMARWAELSLKWPSFTRWLRLGKLRKEDILNYQISSWEDKNYVQDRLKELEIIALNSNKDFNQWRSTLLKKIKSEQDQAQISDMVSKELNWIEIPAIMRFFYEEASFNDDEDRLSSADGTGLW
ncbi:MAG: KAP family P-loop NTPase fold protein, partial [Candidatus Hodarchaeales archaeon]